MTEAQIALAGAAIGALAGVAGGGLAAMAALRGSQLAARAVLATVIHDVGRQLIALRIQVGTPGKDKAEAAFETTWNNLVVQQRILCPSARMDALVDIVRVAGRQIDADPDHVLLLAGQVLHLVTRMVGAHSRHLFAWRARREEARLLREWLDGDVASSLSTPVHLMLERLV